MSSAADCVQLTWSIRYGLYMFGWGGGGGAREAGLCDLRGGRVKEKPVALIITCRYGP